MEATVLDLSPDLSLEGQKNMDFPGSSGGKAPTYSGGNPGSIPGSGGSPGEGNGTPPQHSCLGNPMDRGAWWAAVHGVAKSRTRLSNFTFIFTLAGKHVKTSRQRE